MDDSPLTTTPPMKEPKEPQSVGPLVATIIVVALLALGGAYVFIQELHRIHSNTQEQPSNA